MKRMVLVIAALALAATVATPASATPPQTSTQAKSDRLGNREPGTENQELAIRVTDEMRQHSRIGDIIYFVAQGLDAAILLFILGSGLSRRMADFAARALRWPVLATMLYFILFSVMTTILWFPLSWYAGFWVQHHFDLTDQSFASWLLDEGKEFVVSVAIGAPVAALALFAIRRYRKWWRVVWLGSIPLIVAGTVIWPLVVDPFFNDFVPLQNARLREKLLSEARQAGIAEGRIYQVDKSKQTKTMNAYVTGIGPSQRIVMWDTLLEKLSDDEIVATMGHEMGHYVLHHLWKGIAFSVALSFFTLMAGQRIIEWGVGRFGARWKITSPGEPAALPWLLLVSSIVTFLLAPVISGYSRHVEHQADVFGLELTHLNQATATSFVKFAEDSKQNPYPSRFIEIWRYGHPALGRRVEFALHYKPWAEGKPNELWRPSS